MKETSKAMKRRWAEGAPWTEIFKGDICDVGAGDDPLVVPGCASMTLVDAPDGSGDDLREHVKDRLFDCIHGSNVLEHAIDPVVMLKSWIACLKPGGYIVASVPDWVRYEHCTWPSKFNAAHRSIWSMDSFTPEIESVLRQSSPPWLCQLPEWLNQFLNTKTPMTILLCRLIDTSDHSLPDDVDQTIPADGAEVFIEFVLKRV